MLLKLYTLKVIKIVLDDVRFNDKVPILPSSNHNLTIKASDSGE